MRAFIDSSELSKIGSAIEAQEARTSAEIVTVVTQASDAYGFIPVLWASLLSLILPGIVFLLGLLEHFSELYTLQVLLFLSLALLFRFSELKYTFIPRAVRQQRAARMARQHFFEQKLHHAQGHQGVLLFVSVAERYVEILCDTGVSERIGDDQWQEIIRQFSHQVAGGSVTKGFIDAIEQSGELLAKALPAASDGEASDVLPNRLIILSDSQEEIF